MKLNLQYVLWFPGIGLNLYECDKLLFESMLINENWFETLENNV